MNVEEKPYSQILTDQLEEEAKKAGYTGRDVDGFVSTAIEQRGRKALKKITEDLNIEDKQFDKFKHFLLLISENLENIPNKEDPILIGERDGCILVIHGEYNIDDKLTLIEAYLFESEKVKGKVISFRSTLYGNVAGFDSNPKDISASMVYDNAVNLEITNKLLHSYLKIK